MLQVKVFHHVVQDSINEWLAQHPELDLTDIRVALAGDGGNVRGVTMLFYRTNAPLPDSENDRPAAPPPPNAFHFGR